MNTNLVPVRLTLHTDGSGYYSTKAAAVEVVGLELRVFDNPDDDDLAFSSGELLVHFTKDSWNVHDIGLIYTDKLFVHELIEALSKLGFSSQDVYYSEQGMQLESAVSLDVGEDFIADWQKLGFAIANS